MSREEQPAGVYLRRRMAWKFGSHLGYSGSRVVELAPVDHALVRCLLRGCSDVDSLSVAMCEAGFGGTLEYWKSKVRVVAQSADSILKVTGEVKRRKPHVIVLQLSYQAGEVDGIELARSLSSSLSVWYVTANETFAARAKRWGIVCTPSEFASEFEFLQWVRSLVRRHDSTPILMCGEIDAVCVGEAASCGNTVAALSAQWPGGAGVYQLRPSSAFERDGHDVMDGYTYAALAARVEDGLATLRRCASSAVGNSELWGILGAKKVFYRTRSQANQLMRLGLPASRLEILGAPHAEDVRGGDARPRTGFLVLGDPSVGSEEQMLYVACLAAEVVECGAARFAALWTGSSWYRLSASEGAVHVLPWSGNPPGLRDFVVALGIVSIMEDLSVMPRVLEAGCRLLLAGKRNKDELMAWIPSSLWLTGSVRDWVLALREATASSWVNADATALAARWSLTKCMDGLAERRTVR